MEIKRVGSFHLDRKRRFSMASSRPQVASYLRLPKDLEEVRFDLFEGYPELFDNHQFGYEGLNHVLEFLAQKPHLLDGVNFVTRRGIISKIMCAETKPFSLLASSVDGVIYLADVERGCDDIPLFSYSGHKFEKYIFAGEDQWQK